MHTYMFSGFVEVGGYNGLWEKYGQSMGKPYVPVNATLDNGTDLSSCFALTPYWDHMFRPINDPDYPWLGLWTTLPIMGIWYWCTDQVCLLCNFSMYIIFYSKVAFSDRKSGLVSYT